MTIKQIGKAFLGRLLEAQVKQLRKHNDFTVVAVVGSVGKTTTKLAIAKMLSPSLDVLYQVGNYNDRVTVPLVFFDQIQPSLYDVIGWVKVLRNNKRMLKKQYPFKVVVVELGSDGPGQMKHFAYTKPDILVVTALTDEHMAYFKTLDAVATEELRGASFSKHVLINTSDSPEQYLKDISFTSYGSSDADYKMVAGAVTTNGQLVHIEHDAKSWDVTTHLLGSPGAKAATAAIAVADMLGLSTEQIVANIAKIAPFSGRMQLLKGINNATIIDDSYNASPVAVKVALDVLYGMPAMQRIAVLGSMNEMGVLSPDMHTDVGNYCDPAKLDFVVTIGADAEQYLAPAAQAKGCKVHTFSSPYEAGEFVKQQLQSQAAVLVKGSQNGVFSEETVKLLLADPKDAAKLVRQSDYWLQKKSVQFKR